MLKTIEQHNQEHPFYPGPRYSPSGVKCPACGSELQKDNCTALMSDPSRLSAHCDNCGYRTSIRM